MPPQLLLAAVSSASVLLGLWNTPVDRSQVRVEPCGDDICGYVISSTRLTVEPNQKDVRNRDPSLRNRLIRNLKIMQIHPAAEGQFRGWVYDPKAGHTYQVVVRMRPGDHLELTGCLVGPLCGSQSWDRASGGSAPGAEPHVPNGD
jgi:uncharacterized protein (DUF2147 family)